MLSVVTPIYNERENLPELRRRLVQAMESTGERWEILFVDDGSWDESAEILRRFHEEDSRLKFVRLSRNFGHQPAISAGVHHARGDAVILIDGDLQDPPEVIPELVRRWQGGLQVVMGERRSRADRGPRSLGFRIFYPIMRLITGLDVHNAGIFGLMDRAVVEQFNRLPERNRFIPGLRMWLGFRQGAVPYDRQGRAAGQPKQTFRRLLRYAMDGMISFGYRPLRMMTMAGLLVAGIGFLTALFFIIKRLAFNDPAVTGFTTLLTMMMFLGGVQLIAIGVLGEYIGRIYEEVKQRPLYIVAETLGVDAPAPGRTSGTPT